MLFVFGKAASGEPDVAQTDSSRRWAIASQVNFLCLWPPLRGPRGPPPPAPWQRQTVHTVTAGGSTSLASTL